MLSIKQFAGTRKIIIGLSLILGFLHLSNINVNAQSADARSSSRNNADQIKLADDSDISRIAKVQGFNDGLRRTAIDAGKKRKNPRKTSEYKNGTNGFKGYYGKKKDSEQRYALNKKLTKQVYNEKKLVYQKAYRDGFLEGYNKPDNINSVDSRNKITIKRKRNVFSRLRRLILRS